MTEFMVQGSHVALIYRRAHWYSVYNLNQYKGEKLQLSCDVAIPLEVKVTHNLPHIFLNPCPMQLDDKSSRPLPAFRILSDSKMLLVEVPGPSLRKPPLPDVLSCSQCIPGNPVRQTVSAATCFHTSGEQYLPSHFLSGIYRLDFWIRLCDTVDISPRLTE